jgi:hypothetical protein
MPAEHENTKRSEKHQEKFIHTGKGRADWDLGKLSKRSVGASTEIPRDIRKKMDVLGPMLVSNHMITSSSGYTMFKYCIMVKLIAIDQAVRKLLVPDRALLDEMKMRRVINIEPKTKKEEWEKMYPNSTIIPMSTGIPLVFGELGAKYADYMEENGLLGNEVKATPYNVWRYCTISVVTELWNKWVEPNAST